MLPEFQQSVGTKTTMLNELFRYFICDEANYIFSLSPTLYGGENFNTNVSLHRAPLSFLMGRSEWEGVWGLPGPWTPRNGQGALVSNGL